MRTTSALFKLRGSIHPEYFKGLARDKAIETMPLPERLCVSMAQHLGAPAKPIVSKGDTVLKGQRIGEAVGFISAHVHAPTSGTVVDVEEGPTVSGTRALRVVIQPDGKDNPAPSVAPITDWRSASKEDLLARIADAGVAGMGGAGFPTRVKLSPPPDKPIDTLILNGAECEPYLTADHRLMVERAQQIWQGCEIIRQILGVKTVRVAIESNKPEAIAAMGKAMEGADGDVAICILKTEYPQGAEKQQIFAATGREVPSGGLPMDVGCVVENVGTVYAVWDAVVNGNPLIERVTTVTGHIVAEPKNVLARIGTSYADLLAFCGGLNGPAAKIISGGPMMGIAQSGLENSTTKTTSGLLFLEPGRVQTYSSMPCIACGRCVDACPMDLLPAELSNRIEAGDYDAAEELNVLDCIECGCCSFSCPAHRPLVQHMKMAKSRIILKRRQAQTKSQTK
jgi:electron transport complex protein RnfC